MCCMRLAGNAGPKKSPKIHHLGTIAQLCPAISLQVRHVSTIGNNIVSPTCLHNMLNFGPLAAEICWRVWGTLANFNGFRVLAALLYGDPSSRLATIHQRYRQAGHTGQRSRRIGRTVTCNGRLKRLDGALWAAILYSSACCKQEGAGAS